MTEEITVFEERDELVKKVIQLEDTLERLSSRVVQLHVQVPLSEDTAETMEAMMVALIANVQRFSVTTREDALLRVSVEVLRPK